MSMTIQTEYSEHIANITSKANPKLSINAQGQSVTIRGLRFPDAE